jgi:hypothetical protein
MPPKSADIRSLAGCLLADPQHLAEERPYHHGRRIDPCHAKQVALLREDPFDPFRGQDAGNRQDQLRQTTIDDL